MKQRIPRNVLTGKQWTCQMRLSIPYGREIRKILAKAKELHSLFPLSEKIDFTASTATAELLEGDYDSSDLDLIIALLIKHLKRCDFPTNRQGIAVEEFVAKIRKNFRESGESI